MVSQNSFDRSYSAFSRLRALSHARLSPALRLFVNPCTQEKPGRSRSNDFAGDQNRQSVPVTPPASKRFLNTLRLRQNIWETCLRL